MFVRKQIAFAFVSLQVICIAHCFHVGNNDGSRLSSLSSSSRLPSATFADIRTKQCDSFEQRLLDNLSRNDTTSPITVEGYVTSKRSLGKQLVFVDLQIQQDDKVDICQAMIRKEYFTGENYSGYKRSLLKGSKLRVVGTASPTRNPGNAVLLLQSIELVGVPRQVQHIQIVLNQCMEGNIPREEVANACNLPLPELAQKLGQISKHFGNDLAEAKLMMKEFSKRILADLSDDPTYPAAADQKELSKKGNYVVPQAPNEWLKVPESVKPKFSPTNSIRKETIQDVLNHSLQEADIIYLSGWVQNRRRFEDNITLITLVDNLTLLSEDTSDVLNVPTDRLSCLVHPEVSNDNAGLHPNLFTVGAKVQVEGKLVHDSKGLGKLLLWVHQIKLVRSSSRSVTIRYLLDLMAENKVEIEEAAEALMMPYNEALQVSQTSDATERQWKANQLAVRLQKASQSMRRIVSPELLHTMEKYRPVAKKHPAEMTAILEEEMTTDTKVMPMGMSGSKWITKMPMGMPGSKWRAKKKPQLEWMGQQIRSVLASHPDFGKRKLSILDIGGGKGSLANYLGQAIDDVNIHVIDICAGAVANGEAKAKRLDVPVEFQIADASGSDFDMVEADLVVALHACGHLSDVALAHAINRDAGFVIVPCCFNSNPHLTIPGTSQTAVHDWLGIPASDWTALKLLAEIQGDIPLASEAISILCAVRAEAVRKKMLQKNPEQDPKIEIRQFPIEYSTRNTVLIGTCGGRRLLN